MSKKKKTGSGLTWVRISDINLVPAYLLEQVKPKDWHTEWLYQLCAGTGIDRNPLTVLGVLATAEHEVKGVLWGTMDPLRFVLNVHILSVDRQYQRRGILKEIDGILKKICRANQLRTYCFTTTRPRALEKAGYRRTGLIHMEAPSWEA